MFHISFINKYLESWKVTKIQDLKTDDNSVYFMPYSYLGGKAYEIIAIRLQDVKIDHAKNHTLLVYNNGDAVSSIIFEGLTERLPLFESLDTVKRWVKVIVLPYRITESILAVFPPNTHIDPEVLYLYNDTSSPQEIFHKLSWTLERYGYEEYLKFNPEHIVIFNSFGINNTETDDSRNLTS